VVSGDRRASRRALLGAAGAAALGAIGAGGCGSGARAHTRPAPAIAARDLELLQGALALERRTVAAYVAGMPLLPRPMRATARQFLSDELEHTGELISLIRSVGGHVSPRPNTFQLGHPTDAAGVLSLLHALESAQIATYLRAIPRLDPGAVRAATASILTVDAQHVSLLRLAQGEDPVPAALVSGAQ